MATSGWIFKPSGLRIQGKKGKVRRVPKKW